jgi:glycyl-tRNA synthetase
MDSLVSLCKRRGFIFQSSEIYGGINGFWDYGPLGCELKRNVRELWWRLTVQDRENVVGLDATIIMHPAIWKASGHADGFADPMVDCKTCKKRYRADQLCEEQGEKLVVNNIAGTIADQIDPQGGVLDASPRFRIPDGVKCTHCGGKDLTEPRAFNLMFKTYVGPVEDESSTVWLRPETAQAIFAQFKNVLDSSRQQVPFGIAQIGKSFRNEINPRNFTFRSREFEQMELEFFILPDEVVELLYGKVVTLGDGPDLTKPADNWGWEVWHKFWVEQRMAWYRSIGLPGDSLVEYWQPANELAHYARACVDIQYAFPFGVQELEGIAARSDFDLTQHQKHSGKSQEVFDERLKNATAALDAAAKDAFTAKVVANWESRGKSGEDARAFCVRVFDGKYVPHVIEPSAGVDRLTLALLCNAYCEEWVPKAAGAEARPAEPGKQAPEGYEARTVMRFHPRVAPVKVAVFPLLKNKPELVVKSREVFNLLRSRWPAFWDEAGAIGRRYRRQDEIGTPFGVTIDFDTLADDTVTLRDRDTMKQIRVKIGDLPGMLHERMG